MNPTVSSHALIVGAGPAGLAVAALLTQAGVVSTLLEQRAVGASWRGHYERLHLHTARQFSGLPGLPMPRSFPRYPARQQVVAYLDAYAAHFGLQPCLGQRVTQARRAAGGWQVTTDTDTFTAPVLIVASGYSRVPRHPTWPGLDAFAGQVLHSSEYRNARPFAGQRVLVVGFGNSGAEIALDLHEHGARPTVSQRRPVNVLPRDILGVPTLALGILQRRWPAALADAVNAPVVRAAIGELAPYGLPRPRLGAISEIRREARVPVFDIGTVALIRSGHLPVRPAVDHFTPSAAVFADGRQENFDTVVLATGFTPGLDWLQTTLPVLSRDGLPLRSGSPTHERGLYFCGFQVSSGGMLRDIGLEARQVTAHITAQQV